MTLNTWCHIKCIFLQKLCIALMILILPYNVDHRVLLCMDSTCYTIRYNNNSVMYHEQRHELFYTGNTVIVELNSI